MPWEYSVDVYAAGLIMHELNAGKPIIPKGANAGTTLALLHTFKGPLPQHLAQHATQTTDLPFTPVMLRSNQPIWSHQLDIQRLGISQTRLTELGNAKVKRDIATATADVGGVYFLELTDQLLEYDPAKRPKAKDALKHGYFSHNFPQPALARRR